MTLFHKCEFCDNHAFLSRELHAGQLRVIHFCEKCLDGALGVRARSDMLFNRRREQEPHADAWRVIGSIVGRHDELIWEESQ